MNVNTAIINNNGSINGVINIINNAIVKIKTIIINSPIINFVIMFNFNL